jgi:HK97 family phage major capsid protein
MNEKSIEELMERRSQIAVEVDAEDADLDALEAEARSINEELENRKKAEDQRKEIRSAVANGKGETVETFKTEERKMTLEEIRSSKDYINAYAEYLKTGDDAECRALLTDNVQSPLVGSVPVPTFVEGIIAEELRASRIMSRVRKTYAKGNVKVGFELNAPIATVHAEGSGEMDPENLQLGIVTLVPETLKKFVDISDESLDTMSGEAYLRYIYSEVGRKIIKAEEKKVVDAILAAPQTATATAPAVAKLAITTAGVADFINARALLSSEAEDLVIIATPAQYATYKTLAISAGFAFDPFEGIEVLFSDYATMPIIGDLRGVLANYPNGDEIQYKYDDRTLMTSDLVRVFGRKPVAIEVVGNNYFAKIGTA